MSINRRKTTQNCAIFIIQNTISNKKKECVIDTDVNLGESQIHFLEQMKSDTNKYVVYSSLCMK